MKVSIIYFSPNGNTGKVAEKIKLLAPENFDVQLINITGKNEIFQQKRVKTYLQENIKPHDLLIVGGPVYAHHLQYHVIDLLKQLPKPGGKFGTLSAGFVTYGNINSGISLNEAGQLLKKSGRKVIAGMRITASHCLTRLINIHINKGKPDDEIDEIIMNFWTKIKSRSKNTFNNSELLKSLNYQPFKSRVKAHIIFREKLWQKFLYPKISINHEKCNLCGLCIKNCPVNHLKIENGKVTEVKISDCVTCGNCVNNCSQKAIDMSGNLEKFEEMINNYKNGNSKIASNEYPKNLSF